jgi:hypothetical protein
VQHGGPRVTGLAFLADLACTMEGRCGTDDAVVVQGLHHRHALVATRDVAAGTDQRKGVVEVGHLRSLTPDQVGNLLIAAPRPGHRRSRADQLPPVPDVDVVVAPGVAHDLDTRAAEQVALLPEDVVLAAGRRGAIEIVDHQDFHRTVPAKLQTVATRTPSVTGQMVPVGVG